MLNPSVARGLIETATGGDVVTDAGLSLAKLMEFAGVLQGRPARRIPTYQIEASGREVNGASVLEPTIDGENMQEVLAMFRGETSLADAPQQVFAPTTLAAAAPTARRRPRPPRRRHPRRPRRRPQDRRRTRSASSRPAT